MKILVFVLAVFVLAGCRASKEEIAADENALLAYQALNTERIKMVSSAMASCKIEQAELAGCESDLCRVDLRRESAGCQRAIVDAAGKVALELPKQRVNAAAIAFQELGQTVRTVIPFGAAYAMTRNVVHAMRDVSVQAGRPDINNSTNTTTRDSGNTTSGDVLTAGRDLTGGDRGGDTSTVLGPDAQVGDRGDNNSGNSGRIGSPGSSCTGSQCQPANILNPVDNTPPPDPIPAPAPGDADGICFFFSLVADPDCG